jgi:hypothetical protein
MKSSFRFEAGASCQGDREEKIPSLEDFDVKSSGRRPEGVELTKEGGRLRENPAWLIVE